MSYAPTLHRHALPKSSDAKRLHLSCAPPHHQHVNPDAKRLCLHGGRCDEPKGSHHPTIHDAPCQGRNRHDDANRDASLRSSHRNEERTMGRTTHCHTSPYPNIHDPYNAYRHRSHDAIPIDYPIHKDSPSCSPNSASCWMWETHKHRDHRHKHSSPSVATRHYHIPHPSRADCSQEWHSADCENG